MQPPVTFPHLPHHFYKNHVDLTTIVDETIADLINTMDFTDLEGFPEIQVFPSCVKMVKIYVEITFTTNFVSISLSIH